ncbi:putative cap-gly domain-containing protein [Phaeoacremonium minimum UCRPA7]|uniref:Putative cap-gly domain-containing protein n=1 Tax=Phaeoacremonium minimum (strain UCR-PA7) TaxID=1286976 RepID=R8BS15_PHAM7|nr:putative cap-gly domain-containing protein [Phaeoacremonium minimum UCRPA7]EOO02119.1 putative cap-gly domain-containing protein [Phaeoacremonium minimum UCRPA7]
MATTLTTTNNIRPLRTTNRKPSQIGGIKTASSPNLNQLYSAQSRLVPPSLARKGSFAALTSNSLASIPDDTSGYVDTVLNETSTGGKMAPGPLTPGKAGAADEIQIGDNVDVPGGWGVVRFVGSVQGRKGVFAGVELAQEFASRGKNNGDVDG